MIALDFIPFPTLMGCRLLFQFLIIPRVELGMLMYSLQYVTNVVWHWLQNDTFFLEKKTPGGALQEGMVYPASTGLLKVQGT
jgi:hypothetical protein